MSYIECKIDFTIYSPYEIIDLHQQGLVSLQEIVDSKVAFTFFTDILHDYIRSEGKFDEKTTIASIIAS